MESLKSIRTSISTSQKLLKDENGQDVDHHLYRSMIGGLLYLTASQPDISIVLEFVLDIKQAPKSHI
jgi:hypothetical protein